MAIDQRDANIRAGLKSPAKIMCQIILKDARASTTADASASASVRVQRRRPTTRRSRAIVMISCLIIQQQFQYGSCFVPNGRDARSHKATRMAASNDDDDDNNKQNFRQRVDNFLDRQFFDPDGEAARQEDEGDETSSLKSRFARLVIEDYATAEAIYVGLFFSILLLATQEALRYYMYGVDYVPFSRGGGGNLF